MSRTATKIVNDNRPASISHVFLDEPRFSIERDLHSSISTDSSRSLSSSPASGDWTKVRLPFPSPQPYEDDLCPSDSASRPRHSSRRPSSSRHSSSRQSASRQSSHLQDSRPDLDRHKSAHPHIPVGEEKRSLSSSKPHQSNSHRSRPERHNSHDSRSAPRHLRSPLPIDGSSTTEQYHDDSGYAEHTYYSHADRSYRLSQHPPSSAHYSHFDHNALVHMPQQEPFGYAGPNPFSPPPSIGPQPNPFTPMSPGSTCASADYFGHDSHALPPPRGHSRPTHSSRAASFATSTGYDSEMMSPPHYSYGMPYGASPYAPHGYYSQPGAGIGMDRESEYARMAAMLRSFEEERVAREAVAIAKLESERAIAEQQRKHAEALSDAAKKAKDAAERDASERAKRAKDEADKALADARKKADELEARKKELEEEVKKHKPHADDNKGPIKFKDAVGRRFTFPYRLCKTWKGIEGLIKQAFNHVDVIGQHVHDGHYDLLGPDGDIILPQVWEPSIRPGWEITMVLWPFPEPTEPLAGMLADMDIGHERRGNKEKRSKIDSKSKKRVSTNPDPVVVMPPPPPPMGVSGPFASHVGMMPPPPLPPMAMHDVPDMADDRLPSGIIQVLEPLPRSSKTGSSSSRSRSKKDLPPLAAWMAGRAMKRS